LRQDKDKEAMRWSLQRMKEDLEHPQPGGTLVARVGMSRTVFAERFKATAGMTPMEYLTRWRMLVAGERLRSTRDSIARIAGALGYESESAFGKAFKRMMGCSPRQYGRAEKDKIYR
jgi:AraC-like DNA-binding protein